MNREASKTLWNEAVAPPCLSSRAHQVREVFEEASRYLESRGVDIRFRVDTVKAFASSVRWNSLLDIGCGDGSISAPLFAPGTRGTLLDLSSAMLALAAKKVPEQLAGKVALRNEDFMAAEFDTGFDLIVTVGVLAHVASPDDFLQKIAGLLLPGGSLIIEMTDSQHFVGTLGRAWGALKEVVAPARYPTNKLTFAGVAPLFQKHRLELTSCFRYSRIPLPGINRLLSHDRQYKLSKHLFGSAFANTHPGLGNEYICLLTKI